MQHVNYNDLLAFVAVAKEGSFTRAAAKLGMSQSALGQTIRTLEERLGLRPLVRTTRSVSPTEAGEHMLRTVAPRFDEIEAELALLSEQRAKPTGTILITAGERAALSVLPPALARLMPEYPDINMEVMVENDLADIVAARYDAGTTTATTPTIQAAAMRPRPFACWWMRCAIKAHKRRTWNAGYACTRL